MSVKAGRMKMKKHKEANPLEILLITILAIGGIAYLVITTSTGDPQWFRSNAGFDTRPQMIEIYHDGEKTLLSPGTQAYEQLTDALNEQMRDPEGYYEYSLHPTELERSFKVSTVVVMVYDEPLNIHTYWNLGEPNMLLIPITGAGSFANRVYTGTDRRFGHGALIMKDMTAFTTLVQDDLGFRD